MHPVNLFSFFCDENSRVGNWTGDGNVCTVPLIDFRMTLLFVTNVFRDVHCGFTVTTDINYPQHLNHHFNAFSLLLRGAWWWWCGGV